MKTKDIYNKPEVETVEIQTEGIIATSLLMTEEPVEGNARVRRRLWDEE